MALNLKEVVLRPFNYCIVDEVDSILVMKLNYFDYKTINTFIDKYIVSVRF